MLSPFVRSVNGIFDGSIAIAGPEGATKGDLGEVVGLWGILLLLNMMDCFFDLIGDGKDDLGTIDGVDPR